jgi:hypothetical protein
MVVGFGYNHINAPAVPHWIDAIIGLHKEITSGAMSCFMEIGELAVPALIEMLPLNKEEEWDRASVVLPEMRR